MATQCPLGAGITDGADGASNPDDVEEPPATIAKLDWQQWLLRSLAEVFDDGDGLDVQAENAVAAPTLHHETRTAMHTMIASKP